MTKREVSMSDKKTLRRVVREKIAGIDFAAARVRSSLMCEELKRVFVVSGAKVIALFSPLGDEPQLWPLVEQLSASLSVALPRVEGDVMNFYRYDKEAMATGSYGINEPQWGCLVTASEIDVMVIPGVAFTKEGVRLGRGKGFYDRYLSQNGFSALKIGVCYREQLVAEIPTEPHDVKMDVVIYI